MDQARGVELELVAVAAQAVVLRAEVLGEWPLFGPVQRDAEEEPEPVFATPSDAGADPWTVAAMPAAPVGEEPPPLRPQVRSSRTARYSLDPLGSAPPARRFGRRGGAEAGVRDVPAGPRGERRLPGAAGT